MTKTEALAYFGVTAHNTQWSWGAKSDDGRTIVLNLWHDRFDRDPFRDDGPVIYTFPPLSRSEKSSNGFPEYVRLVQWALAHCGGVVRGVVLWVRDKNATPRETADAKPLRGFAFQILHFDSETGVLIAKRILIADPRIEQATEQATAAA